MFIIEWEELFELYIHDNIKEKMTIPMTPTLSESLKGLQYIDLSSLR